MNCRQCGSEVDPENWTFCPQCGNTLSDEKIYLFLKRFFSSRRNIFLFFSAILLVGAVFGLLLFRTNREIERKNEKISQYLEKEKEISLDWEVEKEIFPITFVGDNRKLITLKVSSPVYATIQVDYQLKGLSRGEKKVIRLSPGSKIHYLEAEISREGYESLKDSQKTEVNLRITLIKENQAREIVFDDTKEVFVYSRNDIIWKENGGSNAKYVVGWIDKDREEIKELVRKASDYMLALGGDSNAITGEFGDQAQIARQMKAIFLAVSRDYQVRYVFAPFSYDSLAVQKIKDPVEVLRTKSGLCIELSLLMAAAFENIGLKPVVVLVPGHAFVGVKLFPKEGGYLFMETTVLDRDPDFAMRTGAEEWQETQAFYELVDVTDLRSEGFLPIKY